MKIIFLGTPGFAVPSLAALVENGYDVVAVITAPDKPAGRGQKLQESEVKKYAISKNITVLQPVKLSDPDFLSEVKKYNADLQIVVAFRMMPEALWSMPKYGTFNLHGSLLPQYRGAAPINRAIMNGEKQTGVTTFFLKQEIDTGNIVFREALSIGENENAGQLHDRMMVTGAELVLKTVRALEANAITFHEQSEFLLPGEVLKPAPKIFNADRKLDFSSTVESLHNHVRGLSPYPGAFFDLDTPTGIISFKVFQSAIETGAPLTTHQVITDQKTFLKISCRNGWLHLVNVQFPGKKRMDIGDLLRGLPISADWRVL